LTGADLANDVNEAALLTGRAGNTQTGHAELEQACTRIMEASGVPSASANRNCASAMSRRMACMKTAGNHAARPAQAPRVPEQASTHRRVVTACRRPAVICIFHLQ